MSRGILDDRRMILVAAYATLGDAITAAERLIAPPDNFYILDTQAPTLKSFSNKDLAKLLINMQERPLGRKYTRDQLMDDIARLLRDVEITTILPKRRKIVSTPWSQPTKKVGATAAIGSFMGEHLKASGALPERSDVLDHAESLGINPSTARTQYSRWKRSLSLGSNDGG